MWMLAWEAGCFTSRSIERCHSEAIIIKSSAPKKAVTKNPRHFHSRLEQTSPNFFHKGMLCVTTDGRGPDTLFPQYNAIIQTKWGKNNVRRSEQFV